MPYEDLYRSYAEDGSLFYTLSVRKAALLIALDNDVRDQADIEVELPGGADYASWKLSEVEPLGKLKVARDMYERALLRSLDAGRLEVAVVARNVEDKVDPQFTLVSIYGIYGWCHDRDVGTGDWLERFEQDEFEFVSGVLDGIAGHYEPGRGNPEPYEPDPDALERYTEAEISERAEQYISLVEEIAQLKGKLARSRKADLDLPINTKEKNSLLTVIAALIEAFKDRLPEGYKRAEKVAGFTDQIGASVSVNTVDKILKQTASAVERRRQAYK